MGVRVEMMEEAKGVMQCNAQRLRRAVSDIISSVKMLTSIGCFVARESLEPLPGQEANEDCLLTIYAPVCRKAMVAEDEYREGCQQKRRTSMRVNNRESPP
jgi:hypothetical protein